MTTEIESTHKNKSVFFPDVLKRIWEDNKGRDWSIYTKDQFRRFWDVHVVEHRV